MWKVVFAILVILMIIGALSYEQHELKPGIGPLPNQKKK